MNTLYWILASFVSYELASVVALFILWVLFVVCMALERARDEGRLTPEMIEFGEGFAGAGIIYDVLCNIFCATVIFFELPQETTVSGRLERLANGDPTKWRTRLAIWFAVFTMNPFCSVDNPHIRLPLKLVKRG